MKTKATTRLEAKREEILTAASAVFAEDGYETASMDRVAERAKASKRTVYNHFGSKEALFEAVIERLFQRWRIRKELAWDPTRPVADQLADFARVKVAITQDPASIALARVSLGVHVRDPRTLARVLSKVAAEEDALAHWLREAHLAGALHVPDPELAAEVFWALAGGALFWPALVGNPTSEPERLVAELVATFLARYRRKPARS